MVTQSDLGANRVYSCIFAPHPLNISEDLMMGGKPHDIEIGGTFVPVLEGTLRLSQA